MNSAKKDDSSKASFFLKPIPNDVWGSKYKRAADAYSEHEFNNARESRVELTGERLFQVAPKVPPAKKTEAFEDESGSAEVRSTSFAK